MGILSSLGRYLCQKWGYQDDDEDALMEIVAHNLEDLMKRLLPIYLGCVYAEKESNEKNPTSLNETVASGRWLLKSWHSVLYKREAYQHYWGTIDRYQKFERTQKLFFWRESSVLSNSR